MRVPLTSQHELMEHILNNTSPTYGVENSPIFTILWHFLSNSYQHKAESNPIKYAQWNSVHAAYQQLMMAWCLRLHQVQCLPPILVKLSLNLFFLRCPQPIWDILSHICLALSYTKTMKLLQLANTTPLPQYLNWPTHPSIVILGGDNMMYTTHRAQVRINPNTNSATYTDVYHTVNFYRCYYPTTAFPAITHYDNILPAINSTNIHLFQQQLIYTYRDFNGVRDLAFQHSSSLLSSGYSSLDYPHIESSHPDEPPYIQFLRPLHNINTASNQDMTKVMEHLYRQYFVQEKSSLVICYGDEQFIARMLHIIQLRGSFYGTILPFPGEFHFQIHLCLALYRLGGKQYLLPLAQTFGFKHLVVDFPLAKWSTHDSFLLMFCDASVAWLQDILPRDLADNHTITDILARVDNSKLFHFIYFVSLCITYAQLRYNIRRNKIETVNDIWLFSWALFVATHKYWYAKLTLYVQHVLKQVHPAVRQALNQRLISFRGKPGHYFGPDLMTEKENMFGRLHIKHPSEHVIDTFYDSLTFGALNDQQLRAFLHMGENQTLKKSNVAHTIKQMTHYIYQQMGGWKEAQACSEDIIGFNGVLISREETAQHRIITAFEKREHWVENNKQMIVDLNGGGGATSNDYDIEDDIGLGDVYDNENGVVFDSDN